MSYFTAVLASDGYGWRARDVGVEEAGSLADLADSLRAVAIDDQPVLAVVEHEDEWFALVRVDDDDDPRVFVSDLHAVAATPFAPVLAAEVEPVSDDGELDETDVDDGEASALDDDRATVATATASTASPTIASAQELSEAEVRLLAGARRTWAGDVELLADLGCPSSRLGSVAEEFGDDPAGAIAAIGEDVGFAEIVEGLR